MPVSLAEYREHLVSCGGPRVELIVEERGTSGGRRRCQGGHAIPAGEAFTRTVCKVDGDIEAVVECDRCHYGFGEA